MSRRAERWALALLVGGLHALLWLVLRGAMLWQPRLTAAVNDTPPLIVRLLPLPTAPALPPATRAPERPHPLPAATVSTHAPAPAAATTQAITVAAPPEPAASAPLARAALELALPRQQSAASAPRSLHEQMLNDPRSNSARATVESRVAAVAGTGQMVEERMDPTRMRVTQNGHCVEVHVSRNAQIDPFNQSVAPTPKLVKPSC